MSFRTNRVEDEARSDTKKSGSSRENEALFFFIWQDFRSGQITANSPRNSMAEARCRVDRFESVTKIKRTVKLERTAPSRAFATRNDR